MRKQVLASVTIGITALLGGVQGNAMGTGIQPLGATVGGAPLSVLQQTTTVSAPLVLGGSLTVNPATTYSPLGLPATGQLSFGASAMVAPANLGSLQYTVNPASLVSPSVPLASISVSQMMPPAPVNYVPPTTVKKTAMAMKMSMVAQPIVAADVATVLQPGTQAGSGPSTANSIAVTPAANYEIAGERPDFSYNSGRLEFKEQPTHTTGQNGMGVGPGLPQGTSRYVPVGEF